MTYSLLLTLHYVDPDSNGGAGYEAELVESSGQVGVFHRSSAMKTALTIFSLSSRLTNVIASRNPVPIAWSTNTGE